MQVRHDDHPGRTGGRLRFDRLEFAGAFGDLGTLIPYVVAYAVFAKIEPTGMLFAFGIALIACGLYFRTPVPGLSYTGSRSGVGFASIDIYETG